MGPTLGWFLWLVVGGVAEAAPSGPPGTFGFSGTAGVGQHAAVSAWDEGVRAIGSPTFLWDFNLEGRVPLGRRQTLDLLFSPVIATVVPATSARFGLRTAAMWHIRFGTSPDLSVAFAAGAVLTVVGGASVTPQATFRVGGDLVGDGGFEFGFYLRPSIGAEVSWDGRDAYLSSSVVGEVSCQWAVRRRR